MNVTNEELLAEVRRRPEVKTKLYQEMLFQFRKEDAACQLIDYFDSQEAALETLKWDDWDELTEALARDFLDNWEDCNQAEK